MSSIWLYFFNRRQAIKSKAQAQTWNEVFEISAKQINIFKNRTEIIRPLKFYCEEIENENRVFYFQLYSSLLIIKDVFKKLFLSKRRIVFIYKWILCGSYKKIKKNST